MEPEAAPPAPAESAPPKGPAWGLRLTHSVAQVATFVMIWWFIGVGRLYASTFEELSMTALPAVSEIVIRMSAVLSQPGVLILGGVLALALIVLGHFGFIDRALAPLIVLDGAVIVLLLIGWFVGLQLPLRRIQETLSP